MSDVPPIRWFGDEGKLPDVPDPSIFVQWKGTDACLDFRCSCGADGHYDGFFCYQIRCAACGLVFDMPSTIALRVSEAPLDDGRLVTVGGDGDE